MCFLLACDWEIVGMAHSLSWHDRRRWGGKYLLVEVLWLSWIEYRARNLTFFILYTNRIVKIHAWWWNVTRDCQGLLMPSWLGETNTAFINPYIFSLNSTPSVCKLPTQVSPQYYTDIRVLKGANLGKEIKSSHMNLLFIKISYVLLNNSFR